MFLLFISEGIKGARQAAGLFQGAAKKGMIRRGIALAGKPIWHNLEKSEGLDALKYKDECKGPRYLFSRYLANWGNTVGVASFGLNAALRFADKFTGDEDDGKKKILGPIRFLLGIVGLASIGAAIYSNVGGPEAPVLDNLDESQRGGAEALQVVADAMKPVDHGQLKNEAERSTLRFKKTDREKFEEFENNADKAVQVFYVGPARSGKSMGIRKLIGKLIIHEEKKGAEGREVDVRTISGRDIEEALEGKDSKQESRASIADEVGALAQSFGSNEVGQVAQMASDFFKNQGNKKAALAVRVFHVIEKMYKDAEEHNAAWDAAKERGETPEGKKQRVVVVLDEFDHLWDLCRLPNNEYDLNSLNRIIKLLAEIIDGKDRDLLLSANVTFQQMVDHACAGGKIDPQAFEKVSGRFVDIIRDIEGVNEFDKEGLKPQIAAAYLRELIHPSREYNYKYSFKGRDPHEVFEDDIANLISEKLDPVKEKALQELIDEKLKANLSKYRIHNYLDSAPLTEADAAKLEEGNRTLIDDVAKKTVQAAGYRLLHGGNIEVSIMQDLYTLFTSRISSGELPEGSKITVDMVVEAIANKSYSHIKAKEKPDKEGKTTEDRVNEKVRARMDAADIADLKKRVSLDNKKAISNRLKVIEDNEGDRYCGLNSLKILFDKVKNDASKRRAVSNYMRHEREDTLYRTESLFTKVNEFLSEKNLLEYIDPDADLDHINAEAVFKMEEINAALEQAGLIENGQQASESGTEPQV